MLVQNLKDLRVANRMYGRKLPTFGYAGHNDEYAQYWRKLIKKMAVKKQIQMEQKSCSILGKVS